MIIPPPAQREKQPIPYLLVAMWASAAVALAWLLLPATAWRDGPEFVGAAWGLGIAHPAGFPVYQSLAWSAEQIPVADILLRNHAFSALCTLIALVLLYAAALSFLKLLKQQDHASRLDHLLAGWVSLCWLAMPAQLENAIQSEAYALHACFSFLICRLLFDFMRTREPRYYVLAVFLAGIGVGNHATLGAFIFPFIIVLAVYTDLGQAVRTALAGFLAGTWGLLVYLYLPVRSLREPSFDWGDAETWPRFWMQVLDRKDAGSRFAALSGEATGGSDSVFLHFFTMYDWLGTIGLLLILGGWLWLMLRHTRLALVCLSWMIFLFVFFLGWYSGTVLTGFLGLLLFGALPLLAAIAVSGRIGRLRLGGPAACALAAVVFLNIFMAGLDFAAKRAAYLPSELVRMQLLDLPYRASVLAGPSWFHLRALADVEGLRPDVSIIGLGDIISPQYFRPLKPEHIPLLRYPQVSMPEIGEPEVALKKQFLKELVFGNAPKSRFYLDLDEGYIQPFLHLLMPEGRLWWARIAWQPQQNDCTAIKATVQSSLSRMLDEPGVLTDPEFGRFLKYGYFSWFTLAQRRTPLCNGVALGMLQWWRKWLPRDPALSQAAIYNDYGAVFAHLGHESGARVMFQLAHALGLPDGTLNLGMWHEKHGNIERAKALYRQAFLQGGRHEAYLALRRLSRQ